MILVPARSAASLMAFEGRSAPSLLPEHENGFGGVRMVDYVRSVKSHDKNPNPKGKNVSDSVLF